MQPILIANNASIFSWKTFFFSNLTSILAAEVRKNVRGALLARQAFIMLDCKGKLYWTLHDVITLDMTSFPFEPSFTWRALSSTYWDLLSTIHYCTLDSFGSRHYALTIAALKNTTTWLLVEYTRVGFISKYQVFRVVTVNNIIFLGVMSCIFVGIIRVSKDPASCVFWLEQSYRKSVIFLET
jgi:hypothetical protein